LIAPLDSESYWVGFHRFSHPWVLGSEDDYCQLRNNLRFIRPWLSNSQLSPVEVIERLDLSRACGYPWDQLYGSTKLHALAGILQLPLEVAREMIVNHEHPAHREACELCFRSLYDYYQNHVSVFSTVLKDELRPTEKDARFFMPAPLEHVVVGLWLFGNSNDRFVETSNNFETPVTVGLDIPGPGASEFWRKVYKHEDVVDYDGASWDANVSMTSLMAIRDERIAGNPAIADEIRELLSYLLSSSAFVHR